jgi:N6-adenosine-specific RNA methylase IME4
MSRRYNIIYCDPPWRYVVWNGKGKGRSAENHYQTMPLSDICALPVGSVAASDSALFLWATLPNLPNAFKVMGAWGFVYKTVCFVWIKKNRKADSLFFGLGHWTRANAEVCLLATKGKPRRASKSVHQVIVTPVEEHSKKPDEARRRIVELMGDVPRVELFARKHSDGWDVWGNEVAGSIDL